MKKSIFIAVLGLATSVSLSHGTGYVYFSSYNANNGSGAITTYGYGAQNPVGVPFQADLYYALGTVSDPVNHSPDASFPTGLTDSGVFAAYDNSGYATLGYFDDPNIVTIPDYTGGPITFEVVAFNGSSYADNFFNGSLYGGPSWRGRSGSFTMDSIATSPMVVPPDLGDNGTPMPNFAVDVAVPEPSSFVMIVCGIILVLLFGANRRRSQRQSNAP
jgi:hypothetical protein